MIKEIIKKAQALSIQSLNKFYFQLDIDPETIKEIYRPVKFGKNFDHEVAYYDASLDEIILDEATINFIKNSLTNAEDKEKIKNNIIRNLAKTIIHETIHSGRTIIKKKNDIDNIDISLIETSYIIGEEYTDDFESRKVVACYVIHNNISNSYKLYNNYKCKKMLLSKDTKTKMNKIYEYNKYINGQIGLEEIITEAFAWMILNNNYYNKLSIETLANTLIYTPNIRSDVLIGSYIIKSFDMNMIKWFLTTRFQSNYIDMFHANFNDDYDSLLNIMDITYKRIKSDNYSKEEEQFLLPEIEKILNKHHHKNNTSFIK